MAKGFLGTSRYKAYLGNIKLKKGYIGNQRVYSAGNVVTYNVSPGVSYQEEVDSDASVLLPTSFTPSLSGWTFVGWRTDTSASGSVLASKTMGDDPITLYAVFRQTVTVTYYNNSTTASRTTGYRYYNNGNTVHPSFTLTQAARSGWTARGWSTGNAGNSSIAYNNAKSFTIGSGTSITLYGMYYQTITLTYYNGSSTAATTSGSRYYNSGSGAIQNPIFNIKATALSGWTFRGWATSAAAAAGIAYNSISNTAFASSTVLYATYYQTITLAYNGNSATSGSTASQSGTRYYNSSGNVANPSFALRANGFARSGYTFSKWALNGTGGTQYAPGATITLGANATMYAVWVSTSYYAIQNGVILNAPGASASYTGGYNNGTGTMQTNGNRYQYYGCGGHTNSTVATWTVSSGWMSTQGNKYLRVGFIDASWGSNPSSAVAEIVGINSSGSQTTIRPSSYLKNLATDTFEIYPATYDVSAYTKILITVKTTCSASHNSHIAIGFQEIYFYN